MPVSAFTSAAQLRNAQYFTIDRQRRESKDLERLQDGSAGLCARGEIARKPAWDVAFRAFPLREIELIVRYAPSSQRTEALRLLRQLAPALLGHGFEPAL